MSFMDEVRTMFHEQKDVIFLHRDVRNVFDNKKVVVLGDSIQRSVYKDLVCMWEDPCDRYLTEIELRAKGELCFLGDELLLGGQLGDKVNGVQYKEVREFCKENTLFRFYFVTRCFNEYVESVLNDFKTLKPDIIIMNSCYWDIHHYGVEGREKYGENLNTLFKSVRDLPYKPLFLWNSALPLADLCKGGFLRQGFKTLPRKQVVWANTVARNLIEQYCFIYVDLFSVLDQNTFFTQAEDGIHWGNKAHRKISNSILTAISRELLIPIPVHHEPFAHRFTSVTFDYHSRPQYQRKELEYYGTDYRIQRRPRFDLDLDLDLQYIRPHSPNDHNFHTPPAFNSRYNESYLLKYPISAFYNDEGYSPLPQFHSRYYSEPALPLQHSNEPRHILYKQRFNKMKKIAKKNPSTSSIPCTPLARQSSTTAKINETAQNNNEPVASRIDSSICTPKTEAVDSISDGDKENTVCIDMTNNNEISKGTTGGDITVSVGSDTQDSTRVKRKREEKDNVQLDPPAKQVKQLDGSSVKCRLTYDSFL